MEQDNDIEIILSEPQTAVLESRKAQTLNMAGQGSGKSRLIGYSSGMFITDFPQLKGFIGANTEMQLTQSTLVPIFKAWSETYGYEEYDAKHNPAGAYVIDKKPPLHFKKFHKFRRYNGIISFYNGATIFLGSLENYMAHDGKEFGWAHLDETKDTKEVALDAVIISRLRQYGLWFDSDGAIHFNDQIKEADGTIPEGWQAWNPLYIHTSPALGGVDWLNKKFKLAPYAKEIKKRVQRREHDFFHREFENMCVVISSAYHNRHNLPPNYLENQEASLRTEEKILKMVHGYPFSKTGGEHFPSFRRDWHVKRVEYVPGDPVHQTWDFNVIPYMTLVCAQIRFLTRYIDPLGNKRDVPEMGDKAVEVMRISIYREYCMEQPVNTVDGCCERFKSDHDPNITEVYYYGDASGLSRIPGLGSYTNFGQIKSVLFEYMHNQSQRVKMPNVGVFKRRDLLDDIFAGKYPEIEIEIDEECEKVIDDFENVKTGVSGKIKEQVEDPETKKKYEKNGHTSDAVEYLVSEVCKSYIKK